MGRTDTRSKQLIRNVVERVRERGRLRKIFYSAQHVIANETLLMQFMRSHKVMNQKLC